MASSGHFLPPLPAERGSRGRVFNVASENVYKKTELEKEFEHNGQTRSSQETTRLKYFNKENNQNQQTASLNIPFPENGMKEFNVLDTTYLMQEEEWPTVMDDALALRSNNLATLPPNDEEILQGIQRDGTLTVRVITWNQQAKDPPPSEQLAENLIPSNFYHIIAINTQECENSFTKSILNPAKTKWEMKLSEVLGTGYEMIRSHALQVSHSVVFIHKAITHLVSKVDSCAIPTGICDTLGNKGGIGISLTIGSSSFCFLNAHLAAHQSELDRRTYEFRKISTEIAKRLGETVIGMENGSPQQESRQYRTRRSCKPSNCTPCCFSREDKTIERNPLVDAFDYVFWGGDFNFRVNGTRDIVDNLLYNNRHSILLNNEQLKLLMHFDPYYHDLIEGPLNFRPTYRYDEGVDTYDSSAKRRVPSWTDRILYKNDDGVKLISYACEQEIRSSDHRPVYATFHVDVSIDSRAFSSDSQTWQSESRSEVCVIS